MQIVNGVYLIALYILLAVYKNKLVVEDKIIDIETDTVADFSILVGYLPNTATAEEIKTFFEQQFGVTVVKCSPAFKVDNLMKLEHHYGELINEI